MAATPSQLSALKDLLAQTTRGIVMTRRRDGGVQSSPMALLSGNGNGNGNGAGDVLFATRATTAKIKNLARDPYTAVCIITDKFVGPWLHVEGEADITYCPMPYRHWSSFMVVAERWATPPPRNSRSACATKIAASCG